MEDMERTISTFHQYKNISDHVAVANVASQGWERLKEFTERSRRFNNQETLFERDITDYSKIQDMIKNFTPYYIMWTTSTKWFENIV
jgi:dynein heavy chain, axonemal